MLSIKVISLSVCLLVVVAEAKPYNSGRARAPAAYSDDSFASAGRAVRQAEEAHPAPEPYSFNYETTDEFGTTLTRTEEGDASGNVKGSYMYRDAAGLYRTVEYGDAGQGFSANIQTNEPGVESHKAADAEYLKN